MFCELKDGSFGYRLPDGKTFDVLPPPPLALEPVEPEDKGSSINLNGVSFGPWRIERLFDKNDLSLKNLFQKFSTGERKTNPSDTGSLIYLDREGKEARRINFFGFTPTHYESISLDSRNSGQAASEILEFDVQRCEYA